MQETIGDLLGDDELEEMRLRENEEAGQVDRNESPATLAQDNSAGQEIKASKEQEQQPAKALQPPPGFSANHLFGDVDDDDPLDLVTNLSFLNDNEEVQPRLMDSAHTSMRSLRCAADMPLHWHRTMRTRLLGQTKLCALICRASTWISQQAAVLRHMAHTS